MYLTALLLCAKAGEEDYSHFQLSSLIPQFKALIVVSAPLLEGHFPRYSSGVPGKPNFIEKEKSKHQHSNFK